MSFRAVTVLIAVLAFLSGLLFDMLHEHAGGRFLILLLSFAFLLGAIYFIRRQLEGQIVQALNDPMNVDSQGMFDDLLDPMLRGLIRILREKQETSLRLAEVSSRFDGVLNNMVEGVAVTSFSGQILLVNTPFEKILGVEERAAVGNRLGLVIRVTAVHELIEEVFRTRSKVIREVEFFEGGNKKTLNVVGTVSEPGDGSGRNHGIFLFYDMSTIRSLERIRKDFVANVSHEIRTPLTSIRGYSEALLDGALSNPEAAQKFLGVISTQADRLSRMVNDLLELSRLESGTVALIRTEIDLGKQIDRLREIFSGRLLERNIDLVCDFFIPFVYSSDESLMDLVLTNLLDNAIKYSHIGGTIRVKAERTDSGTTIQVKDEGVGIPREDMSRIFERFYRVDRARSSSVGGTGLGLSIVRHVVGLLQGKVEIRSDLGVGTTVRLSLPVI